MENVSFSSIHLICMWKMVLLCLTTSERKERRFKQMQLGTYKTGSPQHTHDCLNSFKNKKKHTHFACATEKNTHIYNKTPTTNFYATKRGTSHVKWNKTTTMFVYRRLHQIKPFWFDFSFILVLVCECIIILWQSLLTIFSFVTLLLWTKKNSATINSVSNITWKIKTTFKQ